MNNQWLKIRLKEVGGSSQGLADHLGISAPRVSDMIAGTRNLKVGEIELTASYLKITSDVLLKIFNSDLSNDEISKIISDSPKVSAPSTLAWPIIGTVEAGAWRSRLEYDENNMEYVELPDDKRYPGIPKFALDVVGESMNIEIPHGSQVLCINIFELPPYLQSPEQLNGHYVIVKQKSAGEMFERSIKKMILNQGKIELWPESNHPDFKDPLIPSDNGEEDFVIIEARVIKIMKDV